MKLLYIKRKSRQRKFYTTEMGMLNAKVTSIKKYFLGFPIQTLYKYRETYHGKVKNCEDCNLFI